MGMFPTLSPVVDTALAIHRMRAATLTTYDDYIVVASPLNPHFYWGNYIEVTAGNVNDAHRWVTVFRHHFPNTPWVAINLPDVPTTDSYTAAGLTVEHTQCLVNPGLPYYRAAPATYTIRPFNSGSDWQQSHALTYSEAGEVVSDDGTETFADFLADEYAQRRRQVASGRSQWFGAFDGNGHLVADLGITVIGDRARYQHVQTHLHHRCQGLASNLLYVAAQWADATAARLGTQITHRVIAARPRSVASRLYQHLGFHHVHTDAEAALIVD